MGLQFKTLPASYSKNMKNFLFLSLTILHHKCGAQKHLLVETVDAHEEPRIAEDYAPTGKSCKYKGKTYKDGEHMPCDDGCNTRECENGQPSGCTEMLCLGKSCKYKGKTYEDLEPVPDGGCNTTICRDGKIWNELRGETCIHGGDMVIETGDDMKCEGCANRALCCDGHCTCVSSESDKVLGLTLDEANKLVKKEEIFKVTGTRISSVDDKPRPFEPYVESRLFVKTGKNKKIVRIYEL